MGTATEADGNADPWNGVVDANHIVGDYYYVEQYSARWWLIAAAMCFIIPPLGMFMLGYMVTSNVYSEGGEIPVDFDA